MYSLNILTLLCSTCGIARIHNTWFIEELSWKKDYIPLFCIHLFIEPICSIIIKHVTCIILIILQENLMSKTMARYKSIVFFTNRTIILSMILFAYCKYIKSKVSSLFQFIIFAEKRRTIARCKLQCVLLSIHKLQ